MKDSIGRILVSEQQLLEKIKSWENGLRKTIRAGICCL